MLTGMWYILILLVSSAVAQDHSFQTIYSWGQIEYNFPNDSMRDELIASGDYIPENNLPMGFNIWGNKMFITVARWKPGVASNLNYFWMNDSSASPVLNPYPDWESNDIRMPGTIVDIFRVKVDACDRMWGLDTGVNDVLGEFKALQPMRLVVIDLKTDEIIRSYTLKDSDVKQDSFIADLVVDVEADSCDNAHVYLSDFSTYGMVVYSWAKNDSWRIEHNYFHFDPLNGDYNVSGITFQWTDGVFGMSLSPIQDNGYKTLYFHAMSGITEFSVSTEVLQDDSLTLSNNYYAFHVVGNKGPKTQGPTSVMDQTTAINYFTQVNRHGVACWDTNEKLNPDTFHLVAEDNQTMAFPNDIIIDANSQSLYLFSNNLANFMFATLDPVNNNFYVTAATLDSMTAACKKTK